MASSLQFSPILLSNVNFLRCIPPRRHAYLRDTKSVLCSSNISMYRLSVCVSATSPSPINPAPTDLDFLESGLDETKFVNHKIVGTFGNDEEAVEAFFNGVVISDVSHFGRIRVSGEDRTVFLQNQSTSNFEFLNPGQGCDTVFVTPTARTIDIAHSWIMKNSVYLFVSSETSESITQMLNKYIFFADEVEICNVTQLTRQFLVAGLNCDEVMKCIQLRDIVGQPYGTHRLHNINGINLYVGVGSYISEEGYTLVMSTTDAPSIWESLLSHGTVPMGSAPLERLRIIQGRPSPGRELTNEYNVLEAGLWNSISLNKGCYKGQETISRLITYDGIKQRLFGIKLSSPVEPGSSLFVDGKKVGKLTSCGLGRDPKEHLGLCYVKKTYAVAGGSVAVGNDAVLGTLLEPPFLSRQVQNF